MSEFDLKKAISGSAVSTLDGREVKIAGFNPDAEDFEKILGWVKDDDGWYSQSWFENGNAITEKENKDDLILVRDNIKK